MGLQVWLPLSGNTKQYGLSNITMIGSPSNWVNGKIGQCAHFDGNISNVIYNNTTDFNYTDNFSWAVWIKTNFTGTTSQYAFTNGRADAGGYGYGIKCVSSANCEVRFGNQGYTIPVTGGEWTHLAFTKIGSLITIYKNGSIYSSQTFNGTLPTYSDGNGLGLGCFHYSGNIYPFYGDLNDFRIYDHCLSPREVKEVSKGLVLHYSLAMPGQENLLLNTATPVSWITTYTNTDQWSTKDIYNMKSPVNQLFEANDTATFSFDWEFTPGSSGSITGNFHLETGNVTPWILGSVSKSTGTRNNASNYIDLSATNTSGHVTCTFIVSSSAASAADTFRYFRIRWDKTPKDGTLKLSNCKLERGEIATPWIPNPADAEYSALGFDDGIEYDVSGYQHNGTKVGTITYDADTPRYNTSAYFNGSSDIRSAKSSFGWFDFKEGTVAAWFKPANTTQTWASVGVQNDGGTGSRSFSICNYSGKAATVVGYDSSWGSYSSDYSMSANVWYHLCATITNGDTVKLYVNGELVQTRTVTNTTGTIASTTQFAIGVDLPGSDERFTGHLSDVRFYTTCLSPSDILELYHTPETLSHNGTLLTQGEFVES